jgi:4-aminobutyrate aminotransferase-like enzyme
MGKPLGDGHPLAAVVTTPDIAAAFADTQHYFNTFGGNPVSATVGRAVLEVIANENILANVGATGRYLKAGLDELAARHELVGEVRGKGLFLGVELVTGRADKTPATDAAKRVVEHMRKSGVLIASTGAHSNVLKFRPPMVFRQEHADLVLAALDEALTETV